MKFIASPNFNDRAAGTSLQYIVIHYTAMANAHDAIERLCNPQHAVSAHYIISKEGHTTQLVDERQRAWHAGKSLWRSQDDINSRSIGIELDNTGDCPFPTTQIMVLKKLIKDIMMRYSLEPDCLLGHSDIAPTRKEDPGLYFPWQDLADEGMGLIPSDTNIAQLNEEDATQKLADIGYDVSDLPAAIRAFQRRYGA